MSAVKRISAEEAREIINTTLTSGRIETYILGAAEFIENALSGKGLTEDHLKEIQRWMAAHLIATTSERQLQKAGAGPASATYFGVPGKGLEGSTYGQTVLNLDFTGTLAEMNENYKVARLEAL